MPDVGIELGAACMPNGHASDRATAPGLTSVGGGVCQCESAGYLSVPGRPTNLGYWYSKHKHTRWRDRWAVGE